MGAMIRFARLELSVLAWLLAAVSLAAQTDVTGEWEASYAMPLGPQELNIYLTQEGPRISGHTTSEYGESQVRGTIDGENIAFTFDATDGGKRSSFASPRKWKASECGAPQTSAVAWMARSPPSAATDAGTNAFSRQRRADLRRAVHNLVVLPVPILIRPSR